MTSWLPWRSSSTETSQVSKSSKPADPPSSLPSSLDFKQLTTLPPPLLALASFSLGSASALLAASVYRRYFRRIPNGDWVTPDIFRNRRWVKGVVTSVGDADNFRMYHTPGFGWRWLLKFRDVPSASRDLKNQTIHIRLAGIDAPEASHFGRPAQPYAAEALAWLKSNIEGRRVYCQLIRRDQYGRIVSNVTLASRLFPWRTKPVQLAMLAAGWVTTYEQAGAEYGVWGLEEFKRVEAEARAARKGIWASGKLAETPAEYKRRYAGGGVSFTPNPVPSAEKGAAAPRLRRKQTVLGRFGRWWPWGVRA
ncbi:nuclease [Neolentinus lepideus HHB14362 ss-1]|uniref:Nuclease n=1 Tax=Neolentinus lepideus HHB14362 ss-1 TaxID=1314782 RepID=A0A165SEZ9_9AGAM|nr:nuclease [Neolentinus lepideus HHB14362 ss-1]